MHSFGSAETSDQDLVDLASHGNAAAFGTLYDRYIDQIYRYVYYRLMNHAEAEDLTELAFLKTFELIQQQQSKIHNFKAWIYRTAHNLVIDHYRTRKNPMVLDEALSLEDPDPLPETAVLNGEAEARIHQVINMLEGSYQRVIIYRFINGFSYEETARILETNPGNVRVMQFRALKKLRELLLKEGISA